MIPLGMNEIEKLDLSLQAVGLCVTTASCIRSAISGLNTFHLNVGSGGTDRVLSDGLQVHCIRPLHGSVLCVKREGVCACVCVLALVTVHVGPRGVA